MEYKYLSENRKEQIRRCKREYVKSHPEKQKEWNQTYLQSEKGKLKKAEQNRRYYEKLKQRKLEQNDPYEYDHYRDQELEKEFKGDE